MLWDVEVDCNLKVGDTMHHHCDCAQAAGQDYHSCQVDSVKWFSMDGGF